MSEFNPEKDHASAVFIHCPIKKPKRKGSVLHVLCIREEDVHKQTFWKLPVGRKILKETPEETARRVVKNKAGFDITEKPLREVGRLQKPGHELILFWLQASEEEISSLPKTIMTEGTIFTIKLKEFDDIFFPEERFFKTHRELIKKFIVKGV